ncbi:hypothetical protein [Nocardia sp. NPDC005366]|uniref:hypothetical protein n=1 Tax=Nocardia sp. NPDC005366 TaxID=3156878 RepID=UPI0033A8E420
MTIHATTWMMTSDRSPEYACREPPPAHRIWCLSWLPDLFLLREQALAGMELDELLSDPDLIHDGIAHAAIADRADVLGIDWEHAAVLLYRRIVARELEDWNTCVSRIVQSASRIPHDHE